MSPETITFLLLSSLLALIMLGYPLGFVLSGVSMIFGLIFVGPQIVDMFFLRTYQNFMNYILLAVPLFVLMGIFIEQSGIALKLYEAIRIILGRLKGGLAITTVVTCTIFAAATGIIGASIVTMAILALPAMLKYKYDTSLATGSICAGGALGVLIPPSILILLYGPTAAISVGSLFSAAILPGLLLSFVYIIYIIIKCYLNPSLGPGYGESEQKYTSKEKFSLFMTSVVPVSVLVLAVLGSILFGIAAPTEAAALGAFFSGVLAACYGRLNIKAVKEAAIKTIKTTSMIYLVLIGAGIFSATFTRIGGARVVSDFVLGLPLTNWGILIVMWIVIFLMGMFIDWMGIILIAVPLFTPIAANLGFDPVWFAMMNIVIMQTSFLTPPFAYSIFYLKGVAPPEVKTIDIYRGVLPFIALQVFVVVMLAIFPDIILFFPRVFGVY